MIITKLPDSELTELRQDVGRLVEDTGRMLKRKNELTLQDLAYLQATLTDCATVVNQIKEMTVNHYS